MPWRWPHCRARYLLAPLIGRNSMSMPKYDCRNNRALRVSSITSCVSSRARNHADDACLIINHDSDEPRASRQGAFWRRGATLKFVARHRQAIRRLRRYDTNGFLWYSSMMVRETAEYDLRQWTAATMASARTSMRYRSPMIEYYRRIGLSILTSNGCQVSHDGFHAS